MNAKLFQSDILIFPSSLIFTYFFSFWNLNLIQNVNLLNWMLRFRMESLLQLFNAILNFGNFLRIMIIKEHM